MMRFCLLFLLFAWVSCQKTAKTAQNVSPQKSLADSMAVRFPSLKKPKNVVLMIGDGMGLAQLTATIYSNGNRLEIERMPITGVQKTHAKDNLVTDSAAAATAMASGCKTYNGAVGVGPDGAACPSILELAEEKGWATGLLATCSITHATPAAFVAHVEKRSMTERIAEFFVESEVDFFVGAGMKNFNQRTVDKRDLLQEMMEKGRVVEDFRTKNVAEIRPDPSKNYAFFTDPDEPKAVTDGRDWLPTIGPICLDFLKKRVENGQKRGFFSMIEGSQIDWAGHDNDLPRLIAETLDFDRTVGKTLDWASADGQTLVIVTADHESGGLSINQQSQFGRPLRSSFSTSGHTAVMVPVFAFGPGAEVMGGVMDNTQIFERLRFLMSL